jgi:hypothetical protein
MNNVPRAVYTIFSVSGCQYFAFEVYFDQAAGGDLMIEKTVRIDQQLMISLRDPQTDVIVNEIGHAVLGNQSVAGGEFYSRASLNLIHTDISLHEVNSVFRCRRRQSHFKESTREILMKR